MKKFNVWLTFTLVAAGALTLLVIEPWAGLTLVAIIAAIGAGQMRSRAAARRRRDDGVWRARIWEWHQQLVGPARFGLGWIYPYATVDVTPRPDGLVLTPTTAARRIGHRARTVPWTDVVSAHEHVPGHDTPDGRLSFTRQTPIEIAFTGEFVPPIYRPDWEYLGEDVPGPSELAGVAERYRSDFRAAFGEDAEPGTVPVTFTLEAPEGLASAIRARARGVPLPGAV